MKITFFGATEDVTGSKYLVEHEHTKVLIDCGIFQGNEELNKRNWDPLPIDPKTIDAVVLTHAHIDHTGYVPLLVKNGFKGKIYCSKATYALCRILLIDSGSVQENNAKKEHKKPLYTRREAEESLKYFQTVAYDSPIALHSSLSCTLIRSGHILGSSFVVLSDGNTILTFSGDLGRPDQIIMKSPPQLKHTDYLVLESTYGDRLHDTGDPIEQLGDIINQTVKKGGKIIIPTFAVGRAQKVLYYLYQLKQKHTIPNIPIFLDSPMAIKVTDLYCEFPDEHKFSVKLCEDIFGIATYIHNIDDSKHIDRMKGSAIIVAGSGMADGGRIVDHFKHFISDANNTIVFVGYQADETRGRDLVGGAREIGIDGKTYPVRADIKKLDMLSAHADYNEILAWLSSFGHIKQVFLTHGEIQASESLQKKIKERFGWQVVIPKYAESFELV